MKRVLRKVEGSRWLFEYPEFEEKYPAEPIGDLITKNNTLSFFELNDDDSNLESILAAIALGRPPQHIEYAIIDKDELLKCGCTLEPSKANTLIDHVNDVHFNSTDLIASDLIKIAKIISKSNPPYNKTTKEILGCVKKSIVSGECDETKLRDDFQALLKQYYP